MLLHYCWPLVGAIAHPPASSGHELRVSDTKSVLGDPEGEPAVNRHMAAPLPHCGFQVSTWLLCIGASAPAW